MLLYIALTVFLLSLSYKSGMTEDFQTCGFLNAGIVIVNNYTKAKTCYFPLSRHRNHPIYYGKDYDALARKYPQLLTGQQFIGYQDHQSACKQFGCDLLTIESSNELKYIYGLLLGVSEELLTRYVVSLYGNYFKVFNDNGDGGNYITKALKDSEAQFNWQKQCVGITLKKNGLSVP